MKKTEKNIERTSSPELESICNVAHELSATKDINTLLEFILEEAISITNCDGGSIYRFDTHHKVLNFTVFINCSLGIHLGGTTGRNVDLPSIPLFTEEGKKNLSNVATYCALNKKTVNIADAYHAEGFDFSGMREFDKLNKYHSQSFLSVPLFDMEERILGVLQLINKFSTNDDNSDKISFDQVDEMVIAAFSALSSVGIVRSQLLEAKN